MSKIVAFNIIFENSLKTYFPGETLKGHINLVLNSPIKCRGMKIKLKGEAKTSWTRSHGKGTTKFAGHEGYFFEKQYLDGGEHDEVEWAHGKHTFTFAFRLPSRLPSSVESKLGYIRYTVKAIIDVPWKMDFETKAAFTVISNYDLNTVGDASASVRESKTHRFGLFTLTAPVIAELFIPFRGYVPGQTIPITVNIKNLSKYSIYKMKLKLKKKMIFRVTKPRFEERKKYTTIEEILRDGLGEYRNKTFEEIIQVPSLPPTNIANCSIINIQYRLVLKLYVDKFCARNIKLSTPIIIGTVPLRNDENFAPISPPEARFLMQPSSSTVMPPDYTTVLKHELPPPTYEESMFATANLKDDDDSNHVMGITERFAPRYPVYKFPSNC